MSRRATSRDNEAAASALRVGGRRLVFALEDGSAVPPKRATNAFIKATERAGLPRLSPHGLRHTFATVALEAGVLTKVVADMLGHSSATMTADLSSHTTEPSTRDAPSRVASTMFGTVREQTVCRTRTDTGSEWAGVDVSAGQRGVGGGT